MDNLAVRHVLSIASQCALVGNVQNSAISCTPGHCTRWACGRDEVSGASSCPYAYPTPTRMERIPVHGATVSLVSRSQMYVKYQ